MCHENKSYSITSVLDVNKEKLWSSVEMKQWEENAADYLNVG